jgi:hypothetical protein
VGEASESGAWMGLTVPVLLGLGRASACAPVAAVNRCVFSLLHCSIVLYQAESRPLPLRRSVLVIIGAARTAVQCSAVLCSARFSLAVSAPRLGYCTALQRIADSREHRGLVRRALHSTAGQSQSSPRPCTPPDLGVIRALSSQCTINVAHLPVSRIPAHRVRLPTWTGCCIPLNT